MKLTSKSLLPILILGFGLSVVSVAQSGGGLDSVTAGRTVVRYSAGHRERAAEIARMMENAMSFYQKLLDQRPDVKIFVLSAEDWSKYTSFPVYGMPHYIENKLIVASSDNAMWQSFMSPDAMEGPLADRIRKAYTMPDGKLTMQRFFDLLALHELGHAYHIQGGLTMQRKWMGELFCNIFLHTYIAEVEPKLLDALTVFPEMVVGTGTDGLIFTTLQEFESNYEVIGQQHPRNYGWYQCRLHVAAKKIYDAGGKSVMVRLYDTLKKSTAQMSDEEFADLLSKNVHPEVAAVLLKWEENTRR